MFHVSLPIGMAAGAAVLFSGLTAHARPQYQQSFKETYTKIPVAMVQCGVCHGDGGKDKTILSDYGKDLKDSLGAKNVKGKDAVVKALRDTENKPSPTGETWGTYLLNGKLPPRAK